MTAFQSLKCETASVPRLAYIWMALNASYYLSCRTDRNSKPVEWTWMGGRKNKSSHTYPGNCLSPSLMSISLARPFSYLPLFLPAPKRGRFFFCSPSILIWSPNNAYLVVPWMWNCSYTKRSVWSLNWSKEGQLEEAIVLIADFQLSSFEQPYDPIRTSSCTEELSWRYQKSSPYSYFASGRERQLTNYIGLIKILSFSILKAIYFGWAGRCWRNS